MTPTKPDLIAAALFDFAAYLTILPVIEVGGSADASPVLERLQQFLEDRELKASAEAELPIENWQEMVD